MPGKEGRKKVEMDPSLKGRDDDDEWADSEGADNLPGNYQEHPLLNDLVMDVLFKKFILLNHDETFKSALAHLAELRLVCKAWNHEIGKKIRKQTHIKVDRILNAYPNGLGWEATTGTSTGITGEDQDNDKVFKYSAPMPYAIGTFENLDVTIKNCGAFDTASLFKWFQIMGSSVKSLRLTTSLNCYHQNRFLEKVLKQWCPHLESLTLLGSESFESLIQNSFFAEASLENQCSSLKKFTLFVDRLCWRQWSASTGLTINDLESTGDSEEFQDLKRRREIHNRLLAFVKDLINYVDHAGEEPSLEQNLLARLVRRPIGLSSVNEMSPQTFGSHVPDFFQERFACDPGNEYDGGVLGQLMKMSRVEKFVIQESRIDQEWFFNWIFTMFFYRPNLWRKSIQDLEFIGPCPGVTGGNQLVMLPKNIFPKLGFPLKRLKIGDGVQHGVFRGVLNVEIIIERTLQGYASTLEEVELKMKTTPWHNAVRFPKMPRLKKLVVEVDGCRGFKVSSEDVLRKFPRLERCCLKLGNLDINENGRRRRRPLPLNLFFEYGQYGGIWGHWSHPLKELKLLDEYVDERDLQWMVTWFPKLEKVDLSVRCKAGEDFKAFWEKMRELPLEQVRLSFSGKSRSNKRLGLYEKAIVDNIEGFKDLKWLELVHEAGHPYPLTSELSKHFAKAPKLRVLKFTNFQTTFYGRGKEAQEIKGNLANVVVQLPANRSSARMQIKRKLENTD